MSRLVRLEQLLVDLKRARRWIWELDARAVKLDLDNVSSELLESSIHLGKACDQLEELPLNLPQPASAPPAGEDGGDVPF